MALGLGWKLKGDGRTLGPDEVVAPDERLSWGKTVGLGAQHVVAMFGATFVFPLVMGLNPQLAIMMSGIATIAFLLIVQGKVPSYLGTSAVVRRWCRGDPRQRRRLRRGHRRDPRRGPGARRSSACDPLPRLLGAAQGAAPGRHRCRRHAHRLQPGAGRRRHLLAPGPVGRPRDDALHHRRRRRVPRLHQPHRGLPRADLRHRAVLAARRRPSARSPPCSAGPPRPRRTCAGTPAASATPPGSASRRRRWSPPTARRSSGGTRPSFTVTAILLVLPAVIALIAENTGHVKAVAEMTGHDLDPVMGRAIAADGFGTVLAVLGRRLAHHHLRREHRRHGGHPGLLHGGLLRGRGGRDPLRPVPEVRRARGLDPRWRARRHHRRALRDDRPARREDLEGERGRLRQPDQPRARSPPASSSASATSRSTSPTTSRSRASRSAPSSPSPATTWPAPSPRPSCATGPTAPRIAVGDHVYGDSDGVDDLYQEGYPGAAGRRATPTATARPADPTGTDRPARGPATSGRGGAFPHDPPSRQDRAGEARTVRAPRAAHRRGGRRRARREVGPRRQGARRRAEPHPRAQHAPGQPRPPRRRQRRRRAGCRHVTDAWVRVGALVRHAGLERHEGAFAALPLLRQALRNVAHPAIRNRGTTVGSIAHADPAGEMPSVARAHRRRRRGRRRRAGAARSPAADFFEGPLETTLAPRRARRGRAVRPLRRRARARRSSSPPAATATTPSPASPCAVEVDDGTDPRRPARRSCRSPRCPPSSTSPRRSAGREAGRPAPRRGRRRSCAPTSSPRATSTRAPTTGACSPPS